MTGERETQNDLKHFSKILSGVIRRFPSEAEVPVWFEAVETTFETYGVPRAIWGQLVFPHVVERVRYLATRLSAAELNDYDRVKDTVLEELQLAPGEYLKRFLSAAKGKEEAWMPFATRLRSYLHFYVEAREIKTKDDLIDLLVADQVKARMTPEALSYVTLKEDTNWHRAHELAKLMRVFEQAEEGDRLTARVVREPHSLPPSGLVNTRLACGGRMLNAIVDTGADITVVRESLVPEELRSPSGKIQLKSAFGESVEARLVVLPLTMHSLNSVLADVNEAVPTLCALTDRLISRTDCLLSGEAWELLQKSESSNAPIGAIAAVAAGETEQLATSTPPPESVEGLETSVQTCEEEGASNARRESSPSDAAEIETDDGLSERSKFREQQLKDPTLKEAWENGRRKRSGMLIKDGLLFHRDRLLGQNVHQLVLPAQRRPEVMGLAHESCWGGHLGFRKTKARVKYAFYWPGIERDIREHCSSCHGCQVRSDLRQTDRVPITPLTRPEFPFQTVNIDVIGPLDTPSARGHRYALCVIDLCTRWPEVVCLRSLSAKATCEALLTIFSRTGIPSVICSDCGTNFTAQLTREFLARLGCSPRFSTPDHPESNGAVERWNRVFKNMLFHVIEKEGRGWDRFVPFLLWAYREVPHDTTGVSPFQMLYGRSPTGPLTVLQQSWTGDIPIPVTLRESPAEYLRNLKGQIERAAEEAELTAPARQNAYATQHNKRASPKAFGVGEKVLVFDLDRPGKMYPKWIGPCDVRAKFRDQSYYVDMPDGKHRLVHANKLRPYTCRVQSIGVVFQEDGDFGDIECTPRSMSICPAMRLPESDRRSGRTPH
ncbi:uncharacterized protein LOC115313675 [Ixodes scapularis]|uniref:uncharacterized protein LOC115313675 n=1 Tax=Ixodes scapularis TaxID=6945 RepID=UPI001C39376F|nr:uncharacterized protein LOC115313675 [Ixodes scapularis]